jgi:hypothetical protein
MYPSAEHTPLTVHFRQLIHLRLQFKATLMGVQRPDSQIGLQLFDAISLLLQPGVCYMKLLLQL